MESAGVNPNWIDHMIGQKLPGAHGHYSLPTEEELFEKYRNAYSSIKVYKPSEAETVEDLKRQFAELKIENEELKDRLNSLIAKKSEIDNVMEILVENPEFQALLLRTVKEQMEKRK